jgi:hypothetical protein
MNSSRKPHKKLGFISMPLIDLYVNKGEPGKRISVFAIHSTHIIYIYMIFTHKIWYDAEERASALGNIKLS